MKTLFKKGQRLEYPRDCKPNEQVQILKVYSAGHKYANATSNFYLVESSDCGQDVWSEATVLDGLDLFQYTEILPLPVKKVLHKYCKFDFDYKILEQFLQEIKALGYTFEYYLDATPFNLTKI